ncbi:MAG: GNAT family N-acetyltransferase, partial [Acutalibacteraceae bacterium]
ILLAEWDGAVIGGCGVSPENCFYTESHPETSAFGPLGVLEAFQNRGVGMRLCQTALDRLKARGIQRVYIGYTWLEDWYGKLGAKRCMAYWMGEKTL